MIMGIVEDERGAAPGITSAVWSFPNDLSSFLRAYLMAMGSYPRPSFYQEHYMLFR